MTALPAPRSLRTRVALVALAVLATWVLALLTAVNLLLGARLSGQADALLRTRGEAGAATLQVGPGGEVTVRDTVDDAAIDVGTWIFRGNTVLERPGPSAALDDQARLLVGRGRRFDQSGGSTGVRWYAVPVLQGDRQVGTVVIRLSLAPYRDIQKSALGATVALSLLLLGGAFLAFRAAVSRALRPVESMTHQAARWSIGDVQRRLGRDRRPTELDDLASTLDALLDRVAAVMRHERQLSAEISHELRTPLSRIVAETDLLLAGRDGGTAVREGLVVVRASASELDDILEKVMTAARHPGCRGLGAEVHGAERHGAEGHGAEGHGAEGHGADGHGADGHGADGHSGAGLGLALSRRLLAVADANDQGRAGGARRGAGADAARRLILVTPVERLPSAPRHPGR